MRYMVLPIAASVVSLSSIAFAAPANPLRPGSPGILDLARAGLGPSFRATYRLSGQLAPFPGPSWTVVVAHRGSSPTGGNWLTAGGEWSFVLHAGGGLYVQWIESGNRHITCWRRGQSALSCGAGVTVPSNGSSEAIVPYIPGTVTAALVTATQTTHGNWATSMRASRFGALRCAVGPGVTLCFTARGLPALVQATTPGRIRPFGDVKITLVTTSAGASPADFVPAGKPRGDSTPPI